MGFFWSAVPQNKWPQDEASREEILSNWQEPHGDRRQEIVIIGRHMDREALLQDLRACLLTPKEMKGGPAAWASLPDPDAIYVGGTGRDVSMLVEQAWSRLKSGGRLVTACNSIENLAAMHSLLRSRSLDAAYWMVNIARGIEQLDRIRFEAINPTFLIAATKPA
jgi:hypothetical protein